jgi:hypothetical protein
LLTVRDQPWTWAARNSADRYQRHALDVGWLTSAERMIGARRCGASRIGQAGLRGAGRAEGQPLDCAEALSQG